ncbi:hypothetical protein KY321_02075 [Candidatus Woesearchaeota archaeon]|nr:hypothetical protein [Candidatus Woesearchaeota archaeon]
MVSLSKLGRDFPNYVYQLLPNESNEDSCLVYDLVNDTIRGRFIESKPSFQDSNLTKILETRILKRDRPVVYNEENDQFYSVQTFENEENFQDTLKCHNQLSSVVSVPEIKSQGLLNFLGDEKHYMAYSISDDFIYLPFYLSSEMGDLVFDVSLELGKVCREILNSGYRPSDSLLDYLIDGKNKQILLYNYDLERGIKDSKTKLISEIAPFLDIFTNGNSETFKKGLGL